LVSRLDGATAFVVFLLIVLPSFMLYFVTAQKSPPFHIDPFTNVATSWNLSTHGTVYLREHAEFVGPEYFRTVGWFVEAPDGTVAQYPPGAALWALPFYLVSSGDIEVVAGIPENNLDLGVINLPVPPLTPAAAAASLAVALALGFLGLTIREVASNRHAVAMAYIFGFGTTAWAVASDQLWQHGPAMMWLALGTYLASRASRWGAGLAFGAALVTRPLTAVIAASSGLAQGWRERSVKPVVQIGAGAALGLAALLAYNYVLFDAVSISGGYGDAFVSRTRNADVWWFLGNVFGGLVDPVRGLLVWSPFLVVLVPGLRAAWKAAPAWARGPAIGGVIYLLVHWKANRFSGGDGFFGYRYPLEALVAAAPFLFYSYREWVNQRTIAMKVFRFAVVVAVGLQAGVVLL